MDYIGISEILSQVEKTVEIELSAKRLAHCRSTAETSAFLCERFGLDVEKGRLAGIAHDMCRELVYEEQERIIAQFGSCLYRFHASPSLQALLSDPVYRKKMIHGPAAACMLCHEFGVDDADILEAIALHSIADTGASDLAKVVYIADSLNRFAKGHLTRKRCCIRSIWTRFLSIRLLTWFAGSRNPANLSRLIPLSFIIGCCSHE
jgi:Predicted HD superfamily hydrolase involved in NAD metabolism